jgi:5-methylcytosine-specific restriction endonuclease McrA
LEREAGERGVTSTARSVPEWIGKTPDSTIPDRVKERIARKAVDTCQHCQRKIAPPLRAEFDHIVSLILGGQHRESNLQLLCDACHKAKTRLDVKLKAKVARVRQKNLGIKRPRGQLKGQGFHKADPQHKASAPLEKWRGF